MALQSRKASFETSIDKRNCRRHRLSLEIEARDSGPTSGTVTVYDISNTGLLIETTSSLLIGEKIEVQLPLVGFRTAEIVWASGKLVGCKFYNKLNQGAVSAARLGGDRAYPHDNNLMLERKLQGISMDPIAEKLSIGATLRITAGLAALSWTIPLGLVWFLIK